MQAPDFFTTGKVSVFSVVTLAFTFLLEWLSPPGIYPVSGYVIAVLFTLYADNKLSAVVTSVAASLLIVISVIYFHPEEDFNVVTSNHLTGLVGVLAAMFFVLYLKSLQEKSADDAAQMSSLFMNATEGIILAERSGKIVLANPKAEELFGYTNEEFLRGTIEMLIPDAVRPRHADLRENYMTKPSNRPMGIGRDLFAQRKDGSVFPVEISLSHYKSGRNHYVIAFVIDITVRKQNEEVLITQRKELENVSNEIKALNTNLEQKVEDRTMMLRETLDQLERSKDELSEALEREKELGDLKSRFVSTVSHEFRTPLSTILSSASLIGRYTTTEGQEKRDKHIHRIKESVTHMSSMLEDLLSLGKLEEGLIVAKPETFSLTAFLNDMVSEMQENARASQKFTLHEGYNGELETDKRLLKNILLNLFSNAIKFSPEDGEIVITTTLEKDLLKISVKDSGIGISEEDQQHLFERFFRARNASNIQGTGLGLHIVARYVELLKGDIQLSSKLNEGSVFTVTLPLKMNIS